MQLALNSLELEEANPQLVEKSPQDVEAALERQFTRYNEQTKGKGA